MSATCQYLILYAGTLIAGAALFSGCANPVIAGHELHVLRETPEHQPENFHQTTAWLPRDLRRVAVLPVTALEGELITDQIRERLEQLVPDEVTRTKLFEVVSVTPEQLRRWTGKSRWAVTETLPPDLLAGLREKLGCDAVVFAHVTSYRTHPPLVMGWKLHLVDTREPRTWWACDLVFDAGNRSVAQSAVRFAQERQVGRGGMSESALILQSPGRFSQYALATSLGTLQRNEISP